MDSLETEIKQIKEKIAVFEGDLQQLKRGEVASSKGELKMSSLEEELQQLEEEKITMLNNERKTLQEMSLLKRDIEILTTEKNTLLAEKQNISKENLLLAKQMEEQIQENRVLADSNQRCNQLLTLEQQRQTEQTQLAQRLLNHLHEITDKHNQETHYALMECQKNLEAQFEDKLGRLKQELRSTRSELDIEKFQNVQLRSDNSALKARLSEIDLTCLTEELNTMCSSGHARPDSSVPESG